MSIRINKRRRNQIMRFLTYFVAVMLGFILMYRVYKISYRSYAGSHPQIIEAVATSYTEEQPLQGILLWDEQLLYAPRDGILTYPSPRPHLVAKNEMVAALDGHAVYAPYPAYYYPGLDGQEGKWYYSSLWPEFQPFPEFNNAKLISNGTIIKRGQPIGKLVPQPQALRCIAYLDGTPSIVHNFNNGDMSIKIRTEEDGKDRKAEVLAVKSSGQKLKVFLRLPFFQPVLLRSRRFKASVVTGTQYGVLIPDSAVITTGGKNSVFILNGNSPELHEVDGFPADERNFFIVKGVEPGNKLILNAGGLNIDENIRIW